MKFRRGRHIEPELLDDQTPQRAAPSLADIVRINRFTGGHKVLRLALQQLVGEREPFSLLDVGAATTDAAAEIRRLYPQARVVNLDYRHHHLAQGAGMRVVADAFTVPFRPASFDFVYCGLFLHHFTNDDVVLLLRSFGNLARRHVIVNDLERHVLSYYFLPATAWVARWDPITLHDGPISVQAAFTTTELERLAERAGLKEVRVRRHRPAFRLSLIARPSDTGTAG